MNTAFIFAESMINASTKRPVNQTKEPFIEHALVDNGQYVCCTHKQKISYYDKIRLPNKNNLGISPNGEIIEDNWSLKEEEFRKF